MTMTTHFEIDTIETGQIVKLHNSYCAVVLNKYVSDDGGIILRVQTLRNVWRGFKAELIDTTVAPNGIYPATMDDINAEIAQHQATIASGLDAMLAAIKPEAPALAEHKYVFLYHGVRDFDSFTGTLDEAIRYATLDRRHHNYDRTGVTVARYEAVYQSDMLDDKESDL